MGVLVVFWFLSGSLSLTLFISESQTKYTDLASELGCVCSSQNPAAVLMDLFGQEGDFFPFR